VLIGGIDVGSTREEVVAILGPSQKALPDSDRFAVGDRFVHVRYRGGTVARITPMISAR
jgi:hypothetical protein